MSERRTVETLVRGAKATARAGLMAALCLPCASVAEASEVHYGVTGTGRIALVNLQATNIRQGPLEIWENGDVRDVAGGYSVGVDSFVVARKQTNPDDIQNGWAIYRLDREARRYQPVVELEAALSGVAYGEGTLYGVTYDPARLVSVDLSDGSFQDLEVFEQENDGNVEWSSLAFDEHGALYFLHFNLLAEIGLWLIDLDSRSYQEVSLAAVPEFAAGPSNLVSLGDGWFTSRSGAVQTTFHVQDLMVDESSEEVNGRFLYLGRLSSSFVAFVPAILACEPSDVTLCLHDGRFRVELEWDDPFEPHVGPKPGALLQLAADSGAGWFTSANNLELLVKVLETCSFADHWWVFGAASTDLGYRLKVTDTTTGAERQYGNAAGERSPAITDSSAFPCEEVSS